MGAWGTGVFDDDMALDILDDFDEIEDPANYMEEVFKNALDSEYLEYDQCFEVIISGVLIDAVINKTEYTTLTDDYTHLFELLEELDFKSLLPKAVKSLKVVISNISELNELWEETLDYEEWKANIIGVIERLENASS